MLLFSQWTMILDVLEWYMHVKGFSYVRLDGSTNVSAGEGAREQCSWGLASSSRWGRILI